MDLFSDESDKDMYEAGEFDSDMSIAVSGLENRRVNSRINYSSELNFGISPLYELLLTLRFYALGTMLVSVADFVGVSITSDSRIVKDILRAIAGLYSRYVKVLENTQSGFYKIARFPRVLGAVDCTYVPIQSPNSNIGEKFRNRKGIYSINLQGVCNADLLFMNVVARWPGSAHDATIFNNSLLKVQCEDRIFGNRWLIGESAYPCTSYLLTPVLNPSSLNENRYNDAHVLTRNPIERCFGVWKRRFPVLSLKIRLSLDTTQAIIIATSVLHNICMVNRVVEVNPEIDLDRPLIQTLRKNNITLRLFVCITITIQRDKTLLVTIILIFNLVVYILNTW